MVQRGEVDLETLLYEVPVHFHRNDSNNPVHSIISQSEKKNLPSIELYFSFLEQ